MECKSENRGRCRLCLSTDRSTSSVEGVLWAFQMLTDSSKKTQNKAIPELTKSLCKCTILVALLTPIERDYSVMERWTSQIKTRVCWECRAILHKIQKFKRQASQAQVHFENVAFASDSCLSRLAVDIKTSYDIEYTFDAVNEVFDFDDRQSEIKIFDPKIEIDIGDDEITLLDVWADPVEFPKEEEDSDGIEETAVAADNVEVKLEPPADETIPVKPRRNSNKTEKHKAKIHKKNNVLNETKRNPKNKDEKSKKRFEKDLMPKIHQKIKTVDSSGKCLTCGGVRRRRKKSLESSSVGKEAISCLADSTYKCVACNLTFSEESEALKHGKDVHSEVDVALCRCGVSEKEESLLQKIKVPEKSEAGTYDCDVCGAKLKSEEYFRLHYEPHVSDKRFECDVCGSVYKTRTQMFRHLVVHKPPMFLCDICGKRLPKISTLKTHFLSHASLEDRPHKCNICSRTFITRDKLTIHVRFHDKVKPFKCKLCPYEFYVNFELTRHMKTHHCIGEMEEKTRKEKLKRTVSLCRNKRMNRDETGAQKKNSGVKPLVKQNKGRGNGSDLRCNICGKTFSQKVCLDAHVVVHTGDRPFKCEECGQAFKFQSNVLTHARSVHRADKLHQCTICGAQFKLKGNLTAHMKIHSGEKPFACDICDQKFIRSRNLRNHYKVHTK